MAKEMTVTTGVFDIFSGPAADLPRGQRTPEAVLSALRINPRVSTWDMSESPWLRKCLDDLKSAGLITEDKSEPYPWHRYVVNERVVNEQEDAQ